MTLAEFMRSLQDHDDVGDFAQELYELITDFIDQEPEHYSVEFLNSVQEFYEDTGRMTPKQARAVWDVVESIY